MNFEELETKRQNLYKSKKRNKLTGIILLSIGVIGCIIKVISYNFNEGISFPLALFIVVLSSILIFLGIVFLTIKRNDIKNYSKACKDEIVLNYLNKIYDDAKYNMYDGIPLPEILNSGLINRFPNINKMEDYIEARYRNVLFKMCDCDLIEENTYVDSRGNTRTTREQVFKGLWIQIQLNRSFDCNITILNKSKIMDSYKGLSKVEVESIDFTDNFQTYTDNETSFYYIFSPSFIEQFLEISKMFKGRLLFNLKGNKINIGIYDNFDHFEFDISRPLDYDYVDSYCLQFKIIGTIINKLKLYQDKFMDPNFGSFDASLLDDNNVNQPFNGFINISEEDIKKFIKHD